MAQFTRDMIKDVGDTMLEELRPSYNPEDQRWTLVVPGMSRTVARDVTKYHEESWRSHEMSMLVRHYLADRGVIARIAEIDEILSYLKDSQYTSWCQDAMTLARERRRQIKEGEQSVTAQ